MTKRRTVFVSLVALGSSVLGPLSGCKAETQDPSATQAGTQVETTSGAGGGAGGDGGGGSGVDAGADAAASGWLLVDVKDFDTLPAGETSYSVDYQRGHVVMSWAQNQDAWSFLATWSEPPQQLASSGTVSLSTTLETTNDVGNAYSANGTFDVWFDRMTTLEPGSVGAPVDDPSLTTDSVHYDIHHGTPLPQQTKPLMMPASVLGDAKAGDRVALMVVVYDGRALGTRYVYEWK